MAYTRYRLRRKTASGYDTVHMESNASVIFRWTNDAVDTSKTVEQSLTALETAIGNAQGDLTGKMALVTSPTNGNLLSVNAAGQAVDSGKKAADFANASHTHTIAQVTNLQSSLNAKAPLASPEFTGTPKAPTAAAATNTTQVATTAFVQTAVNALMDAKDALRFVGTLTPGASAKLPAAEAGYVYRITADGTISGLTVHTGDTATCCVDGTAADKPANWFITHTNHDGQVMGPTSAVAAHVAIFDGTTGKLIKDSGYTIASSVPANAKFTDTVYTHPNAAANVGSFGPSANASPAQGGTFTVPYVTVNAQGHVSAAANKTITLPSGVSISWATSQPTNQAVNDIWMEAIS